MSSLDSTATGAENTDRKHRPAALGQPQRRCTL